MAIGACVPWGFLLLSGLSYLLAEAQGARPLTSGLGHLRKIGRF